MIPTISQRLRIHFFEVLNEKFSDFELRQLYDKAGRTLARSWLGGKHEASTGLKWFPPRFNMVLAWLKFGFPL